MSASIDAVLQAAVAAGAVPNVVGVAADRDGVIYEGAAGPRAVGEADPAGPDTMFRIASMTKMTTTVAALQLVERGSLDLRSPVAAYLPEFADLQVLDGFDGDTPRLRPPASAATVSQLVTHTSGLTYWFWNPDMARYEQLTGTPNVLAGTNGAFTAPLVADPGTRFEYGTNTDWLGRVIETTSGQSLDKYLAANVFGPLGMDSATFLMSPEQRAVSAPVHFKGPDGWMVTAIDWNQDPDYWSGGHGLHCTPRDYLKFQRMLLGNGTLDGARVLTEASVDAAFRNQIGDLDFPASIPSGDPMAACALSLGPGWKFGHGLLLNSADIPGRRAAWTGSWAGLINAHYWVDRTSGIAGALYSQFLPFVTAESLELYGAYEEAVYASRG